MRNKGYAALAGAGVMAIFLAAFAMGTPGQTAPPAPPQAPAPAARPAPPTAPQAPEADAEESEVDMENQARHLDELSAKLANLSSKLETEEPNLSQLEKKVIELNPDEFMVQADGEESGWLGIEIAEISADHAKELKLAAVRGVEVVNVEQDGPAAKAGLKDHDVITSYDEEKVEGRAQFRRLVRETPPGRTVSLGISRDGNVQSVSVVIGDRSEQGDRKVRAFRQLDHLPSMPSAFVMPDFDLQFAAPEMWDMHTPLLGISAEDLNGQLGAYFGAPNGEGILVREVRSGTPAEKAGLKAGDVITKIGDKPVKSLHDLRTELRGKGDQKTVNLSVLRKGSAMNLQIEIEKPRPIDPPQIMNRAQL